MRFGGAVIKITRFHLILFGIIIVIAAIYFSQVRQERQRAREIAAIEAERRSQRKRAEEEKLRQQEREKKEDLAVQAVAVAGEYRIAAARANRDVTAGETSLRLAKESLARNNFDEAFVLARQAIDEFQTAPFLAVYYTVRRGDSLWKIAKMPQHYNRGSKWVRIWRANEEKIPDFDLIHPRLVLLVPKP